MRTHAFAALLLLSPAAALAARPAAPQEVPPQTEAINQRVRAAWEDADVTPSPVAPDGEWCRRIYLDLLGRIPTYDELTTFLADSSQDKRAELVNRLLGSEYQQEYARNFTTVWTNLLVGRTGGNGRDSLVSRPGMQQYLRDAFMGNKPYDAMMHELVTATGSVRPGEPDFNGAANFLADKMGESGVQATAKTSQVFLGMAVQCTQCHNHPFNEYKQNQFWEMNAFFRQTHAFREQEEDADRAYARIVDRDFAGEGGDPTKAELYYELRNGKLKVAYPVFVDGTSLVSLHADKGEDFGDSGYLSDVNRRRELADLIAGSDLFPKAMVNRMWSHFLGYGFTKPIDDMGPHNPPSHPELLDELAEQFRYNEYDLKELVRWIVLSEPYSLSSRSTRRNEADEPAMGARPLFSRFYLRQMQAEQLYESLLAATRADQSVAYDRREAMKRQWLDQFNTAFGNDENGEATTFNGSIPQALMLMNGPLVAQATRCTPGSYLHTVATDNNLSNAQKIRRLYLAALSREPERRELNISNQILLARKGDVPQALQDVWWAILNSNEFILNH